MHLPGTPLIIGWKEKIHLPWWGIAKVHAKMDTGARTSAIDGEIEEIRLSADGHPMAKVRVWLSRHRRRPPRIVNALLIRRTRVRHTGGTSDERAVIETAIRLAGIERRIQLTIANRSRMLTPLILGREALAGWFVVDTKRKYTIRD